MEDEGEEEEDSGPLLLQAAWQVTTQQNQPSCTCMWCMGSNTNHIGSLLIPTSYEKGIHMVMCVHYSYNNRAGLAWLATPAWLGHLRGLRWLAGMPLVGRSARWTARYCACLAAVSCRRAHCCWNIMQYAVYTCILH